MKIKIEKWAKYVYFFWWFFFQSENIWQIEISQQITIFRKNNVFQVKLIRLVDLNELRDSYFYYLFFINNFLFLLLFFTFSWKSKLKNEQSMCISFSEFFSKWTYGRLKFHNKLQYLEEILYCILPPTQWKYKDFLDTFWKLYILVIFASDSTLHSPSLIQFDLVWS